MLKKNSQLKMSGKNRTVKFDRQIEACLLFLEILFFIFNFCYSLWSLFFFQSDCVNLVINVAQSKNKLKSSSMKLI